jgi:hypothetical protein
MTCKKTNTKTKAPKQIPEAKPKEKISPMTVEPCDYGKLGNSKKNISKEKGFFSVPELTTKGAQGCNIRKTLTFYFDNEEDYAKVVEMFDNKKSNKGIPYMSTERLMAVLEELA